MRKIFIENDLVGLFPDKDGEEKLDELLVILLRS